MAARSRIADGASLLPALEELFRLTSHALRDGIGIRASLSVEFEGSQAGDSKVSKISSDQDPKYSHTQREGEHGDGLMQCTLHVCTSCRSPGAPREPRESRPGFVLYQQLLEAFGNTPLRDRVNVQPAECLSVCPRPCGIALASPGAWSYLFGDQHPGESAGDILECVSLYLEYLESADGFMARKQRPKPLQGSILGRVPP